MNKFSIVALRGACAAALVLLTAAAPAQAEKADSSRQSVRSETAAGGSGQTSAKPAQPVKYCVSDQITGSRMAKKVCKTKVEWEAEGVDIGAK